MYLFSDSAWWILYKTMFDCNKSCQFFLAPSSSKKRHKLSLRLGREYVWKSTVKPCHGLGFRLNFWPGHFITIKSFDLNSTLALVFVQDSCPAGRSAYAKSLVFCVSNRFPYRIARHLSLPSRQLLLTGWRMRIRPPCFHGDGEDRFHFSKAHVFKMLIVLPYRLESRNYVRTCHVATNIFFKYNLKLKDVYASSLSRRYVYKSLFWSMESWVNLLPSFSFTVYNLMGINVKSTFSSKTTAVSKPGTMFWRRRQAAVLRLTSRLVMIYVSKSCKAGRNLWKQLLNSGYTWIFADIWWKLNANLYNAISWTCTHFIHLLC